MIKSSNLPEKLELDFISVPVGSHTNQTSVLCNIVLCVSCFGLPISNSKCAGFVFL